jgi:hypothetical protein
MTRRRVLGLVAGGAAALVAGCGQRGSDAASGFAPAGSSASQGAPARASWRDVQPVDFSARFVAFPVADEPNADPAKVAWPDWITRAGGDVKRLYEFQLANGELMRYMPCFCGCGRTSAHKSNRDCYVREVRSDGSVVFDDMAPT